MWPQRFDVNIGSSFEAHVAGGTRTIRVLGVEEHYEPDFWCAENPSRESLREARVTLDVSGERAVLRMRPYEMPAVVHGVRLYAELTRNWAADCRYSKIEDLNTDVRLSVLAADMPWGPEDLVFPLREYRWRSSTYMNTWLSLVPFNSLYYHRGEDYGAIPNRVPVVAAEAGRVAVSPLPLGDGQSNGLSVRTSEGVEIRCAHMDLEGIPPRLTAGAEVARGETLGRTGQTWAGRTCQTHDPHLHLGFHAEGTKFSPFPFMAAAYFRSFPDELLPIAGGFAFTVPGRPIALDGSRSLARPGERIASYTWRLHDGQTVSGAQAEVRYERPGYYAEELVVRSASGAEDRDSIHVTVYDPARSEAHDIPRGWLHYAPARAIRPGTSVLFWNRLSGLAEAPEIEFGDSSARTTIESQVEHAYARPGIFTVSVHGRGLRGEPVLAKLRVVVEP